VIQYDAAVTSLFVKVQIYRVLIIKLPSMVFLVSDPSSIKILCPKISNPTELVTFTNLTPWSVTNLELE
jgi:hypothetical protein